MNTLFLVLFALLSFVASATVNVPSPKAESTNCEVLLDPFLWLEEVEGERALAWVKEQNERTQKILESDPEFKSILEDIKSINFAKDRTPFGNFHHGYFWNFWQDKKHKQGILRRTTYAEYLKKKPKWETVLDLDALSKAEGETWVFGGSQSLVPGGSRVLLSLSRGGSDAHVAREYDIETRQFIKDGFVVPEGLSYTARLDENSIFVASEEREDELTISGHPRFFKIWKRGETLAEAKTVFEIPKNHLQGFGYRIVHGEEKYVLFGSYETAWERHDYIQEGDGSLRKLPLPATSSMEDIRGGQIYYRIKEELKAGERVFKAGSLLRLAVHETSLENSVEVWKPHDGQTLESVSIGADKILITILDNITSHMLELKPAHENMYATRELQLPTGGIFSLSPKDDEDPTSFPMFTFENFLTPTTQYRLHEQNGVYSYVPIKQAPARFDSSQFEAVQNFATSKDGTKVPYFVLKRKDLVLDGTNPTILYGYGGFEHSLSPYYSAKIGKIWLNRGGVYAIANIRGGGEYGPEWHRAALRENRQRAFDDFAAVGEDLQARQITSPLHSGISGGSNGGLLMGVTMTQRPGLFNAALIQVPLLDMARYSKLLTGSTWIGEYGDPDEPADLEFLLKYSPYHNLHEGQPYPIPFFTTSTKDDRVHPGHARKTAAKMMAMGYPVLYFENMEGGHAGTANMDQGAYLEALEYTYLLRQLRR